MDGAGDEEEVSGEWRWSGEQRVGGGREEGARDFGVVQGSAGEVRAARVVARAADGVGAASNDSSVSNSVESTWYMGCAGDVSGRSSSLNSGGESSGCGCRSWTMPFSSAGKVLGKAEMHRDIVGNSVSIWDAVSKVLGRLRQKVPSCSGSPAVVSGRSRF